MNPGAILYTFTFSDTRTEQDDEGGRRLGELLVGGGFAVARHRIVREDEAEIARAIDEALSDPAPHALIATGGTGIAPRDHAAEVIEARLERSLPGFGEAFRRLSWEQVGARSILSRAVAGTARGKLLVALPGSVKAVELGVERVLLPILPHALDLLAGRTAHKEGARR